MINDDPVLLDDWHPVAAACDVPAGVTLPVQLLQRELVLWRDSAGGIAAWDDRCPHRGARLSIGRVVDGELACRYHGWRFDGSGSCTRMPAQPDFRPSPDVRADVFQACERYGLIWVCLGQATCDVVPFEEHDDVRLRPVVCGPYDVQTSGPRVIENFLDMAHFGFVHDGVLGSADDTAVPPYEVEEFVDGSGARGVRARNCAATQPRASLQAQATAQVRYSYRVSRPLSAVLTKQVVGSDIAEGISVHVQPLGEELSRAWFVYAGARSSHDDDAVRAFQHLIFEQDRPVLESQRPKKLPLALRAEMPQRADALSAAYRRHLRDRGVRFGVTDEVPARRSGQP
jgi:phenylpropionate dioxygenase-like ring-hydroxylating dioxygenase large terminal subunit